MNSNTKHFYINTPEPTRPNWARVHTIEVLGLITILAIGTLIFNPFQAGEKGMITSTVIACTGILLVIYNIIQLINEPVVKK